MRDFLKLIMCVAALAFVLFTSASVTVAPSDHYLNDTDTVVVEEVQPDDLTGGNSAADVLGILNENVLDLLDRSQRLDLIDSYDAGRRPAMVMNQREGVSVLDTLTADYAKVTLTDSSSLQIKIFDTQKGGKVVMTIYTVGGEDTAADSDVRFFTFAADNSLLPVATKNMKNFFKAPELKDFFSIPKGCATNMKEIREAIPFPTIVYVAAPGSNTVNASLTSGKYINLDDYNIFKLFELPEVPYEWNGKKLVKVKL